MTKWFRIVGRMTLESMPLCGLIALVNPSLILLGTPTYIFEADSWFILGGMFFVSSLTLGVLLSSAPVRWQPWIISSLRALFALAFIITVFYPKGGHRLDGVIPEEPSLRNIVFLYIIYILAFITLLFAIYRRKQAMQRVHLVILLVCIAVVGYSIYDGSQKTWVAGQKQLTSAAGEMSYGKGKNIVFILADMLQGSTIEQFFSLNAENARPFEGFTVFTRATSPFPFTNYSLPALLSGKLYAADGAPDVRENLEAGAKTVSNRE